MRHDALILSRVSQLCLLCELGEIKGAETQSMSGIFTFTGTPFSSPL